MDQLSNYEHKIDFLLSNDASLSQPKQTIVKPKRKIKKLCNECNQKREFLDESHQVCHICYRMKSVYKPSGNKVIDDFIRYTLTTGGNKLEGKMEFVPYDRFKNVEFIAEGGFSKIYKAIWIDSPAIKRWNKEQQSFCRPTYNKNYQVVLKKLNNSKNITSKEINEVIIIIN